MNFKRLIKNKYLIGSLLVTILYLIFLILNHVFPFDKNTILNEDLYEQYIDFFCYLKKILIGQKGLFMSWNLGLANNFYTNFFWQLSNPINIFVIFFKDSQMYIFMELLIYIKLLLIFNCFVLFIEKVYEYKKIDLIIFGILYTFSSYVVKYYLNVMWLDVLYMLPISILFINKYIDNGKIYPIIICYIYMLFLQYYMAYSMIIFCSIYYVAEFWIKKRINKTNFKNFMRKTLFLFICTVLAVGTAMVIFVPTLSILKEITTENNVYIYTKNISLVNIINNFTNKFEYEVTQKMGFAFCGSIITVLLLIFFMNKNITIKEKIIYILLVIFLVLPVISPFLYRLWHGGTVTHGYNFRYSYLFIFVFMVIGFRTYQDTKLSKNAFLIVYEFFSIMMLIDFILLMKVFLNGYRVIYIKTAISSLFIYLIITVLFIQSHYKNKGKHEKYTFIILTIIEIIELCIVFYYNHTLGAMIEKYNSNNKIAEYINNNIDDKEINRVLIENEAPLNQSLRYNYSTYYFFTSGRRIKTLIDMNNMGFTTSYNVISPFEKTYINDMMTGVKYNIKPYKENNNLLMYVGSINDEYYIYENEYSFPFAYYISDNIDTSKYNNPFEVQNEILNNYGTKTSDKFIYNIEDENDVIISKIEENDDIYYCYCIKYELTALKDTQVYLSMNNKESNILITKENEDFIYSQAIYEDELTWPPNLVREKYYAKHNIFYIASLKKGEKYSFELEIDKEDYNPEKLKIYVFDDDKIKDKIANSNQNIFNITTIGKDEIEGTINLQNDELVCFEIAFDEGWHIEIDGKEIQKEAIYDVFLGAKITKGTHDVRLYYIPEGFKMGLLLSILSLIILSTLLFIKEEHCKHIN